jgi:hypothetical protein
MFIIHLRTKYLGILGFLGEIERDVKNRECSYQSEIALVFKAKEASS